jgi:hypothetical protein
VADLSKLSDDELETAQRTVMAKRAKAEEALKLEARALQDEADRRAKETRLAAIVDSLSDDERAALRAALEA